MAARDHGLAKLLIDRPSRQILGAHILGPEASNMIHLFIVALKTHATLDDLLDMIFIHPALPEIARPAEPQRASIQRANANCSVRNGPNQQWHSSPTDAGSLVQGAPLEAHPRNWQD